MPKPLARGTDSSANSNLSQFRLSRTQFSLCYWDVEVDTDSTFTPPAQPRAERESLVARVPRKRRWEGGAEKGQQRDSAALKRKRPLQELCSRSKQKARRLVLPASSAETGHAAEGKDSPSSEEDRSARTVERSADLPTPKARTPSAEARWPSGQEKQHTAPTNVPAANRCFASEQALFADSTSGQEPSAAAPKAQRRSGKEPTDKAPSALGPSTQELVSREPSAEAPPDDATSAQEHSAQETLGEPPSAQLPSAIDAFGNMPLVEAPPAEAPSAEAQREKQDDGEKGETRVPSA
ncbi:hypothetical protein AXG93_2743s1020 [Marchantia polymorpha subsp. ruderalis]|uniref:Uncharacterized protein n=1 Tax=Marchantia polymorpha subsp. ruderalis TaxID=1480154 RepID=A0A176VPJ5_MARPO|nr:hypothetical protein AXG93_2743s1020 [Marchantia polymorpha subsp. ruderalis]